MKRFLLITVLALCYSLTTLAQDETRIVRVTLNTGTVLDGTIKFENDDVLLLVTDRGERFQLQKSEIKSIGEPVQEVSEVREQSSSTPFGVMLTIGGGGAWTSHDSRANVNVDLIMGHRLLLSGAMFLGAGIGYSGGLKKNDNWNTLPVYLHMRYNFLPTKKNAPVMSISAGYAISLTKDVKGGALGDVSLMYRHVVGTRSAIAVGVYFRAHGYRAQQTTTIDGENYTGKQNGALCALGGRIAIEM